MTDKSPPQDLNEADLDDVDGGGFLEPVITRKPKSDLVDSDLKLNRTVSLQSGTLKTGF